jgi:hypothetical protein
MAKERGRIDIVGGVISDLPLALASSSGVIGSLLGGLSTTGSLGSNLPDIMSPVRCTCEERRVKRREDGIGRERERERELVSVYDVSGNNTLSATCREEQDSCNSIVDTIAYVHTLITYFVVGCSGVKKRPCTVFQFTPVSLGLNL